MDAQAAQDAQTDGDDPQVWRCKQCGARQPDPDPPCERCWNTTFVTGEGASAVAGPNTAPTLGATAPQVARVKAATGRSAALSGMLTAVFALVHGTVSLGQTLDGLVLTGLVAAGGTTAVFLFVAVLAALADSVGGVATE
ncbi:hypothetical protein [Halobacterium bonnevillei]|uniref:Uncharacterized protein n=1 Tax=Halobacterium bonnevillei TaxID=2692200 RepID=A0A6B0SN92_9EURY|nr:hypothetical protein [Halobacterium bonnevillei]MXR20452.1 hypothetical protein [Halobacterium bonnevillei]